MTDVLLTHSYFLRFDRKQLRTGQPYPPLATLYAASVLRNSGISVSLFDSMLAKSESEIKVAIERESPRIVAVYDDSFNYLTKMCLARMREAVYKMIDIAKQAGCTTIISSSDSADHVQEYLNRGADFVINGEGEQTLVELTNSILKNGTTDLEEIPGVSYSRNGAVIRTRPRRTITNLDNLPMPAWDLVDMEAYRRSWTSSGYFSLNVVTTRGCPYGCNWCAKPIYGRVYNTRSPQNVVNEIKYLKEKFNPDHIWFCDDIFGLTPGWLRQFTIEMKNAGLKIRYKCLSRPDLLLKEDSFSSLADSGCETVWIGAESGSQKILDLMEKGTTVDQIRSATRQLKQHGIKVGYFIQFGYPGETFPDIRKTIDMMTEEAPDEIGISVSYPLPNTKFFQMVKHRLGAKQNWFDSDDMALLFPGEYRPAFYRALHKVVHRIHRVRRIMSGTERLRLRSAAALAYSLATVPIHLIEMICMSRRNLARVVLNMPQSSGNVEHASGMETSWK